MTLYICNHVPFHYEVIESVIVKYPEIIGKAKIDKIYLMVKSDESFRKYITAKYPKVIMGVPKTFDFTINCTVYPKDLVSISKTDSKRFFYLSHERSPELERLSNVYFLMPWVRNFFQANLLPYSNLGRVKTEYPIYVLQGNLVGIRRDFSLLKKILEVETDLKFKIKLLGRGKLDDSLYNKYKDRLICKYNMDFQGFHREFLDCYCLLPLITKKSHSHYYEKKITSSYNYITGYGLRALVDVEFAEKYKLDKDKTTTFTDENDIQGKFLETLERFYKLPAESGLNCT